MFCWFKGLLVEQFLDHKFSSQTPVKPSGRINYPQKCAVLLRGACLAHFFQAELDICTQTWTCDRTALLTLGVITPQVVYMSQWVFPQVSQVEFFYTAQWHQVTRNTERQAQQCCHFAVVRFIRPAWHVSGLMVSVWPNKTSWIRG